MKKVESIWAELSAKQVELSEEKVELSVAQDLQKGITKVSAEIKKMQSAISSFNKAEDVFEDAKDALRDAMRDSGDIENAQIDIVNQAETSAKELGVDVSAIKGYKELIDSIEDMQVLYKEMNQLV
jgi:hypothetical protein